MGTTQDIDRVSRVRSPREPPLTPTSSVDTSGARRRLLSGPDRTWHTSSVPGKYP